MSRSTYCRSDIAGGGCHQHKEYCLTSSVGCIPCFFAIFHKPRQWRCQGLCWLCSFFLLPQQRQIFRCDVLLFDPINAFAVRLIDSYVHALGEARNISVNG